MVKEVHVGLAIEQKMNELGVSKSELARRVGIANQNMARIIGNESMDTARLIDFCRALDFNFFSLFTEDGQTSHLEITGAHEVSGQNATVIGNQNLSESFVLTLLSKKDEQIEKLLEIIKEK